MDHIQNEMHFDRHGYLFVPQLLPKAILNYLKIYYDILRDNGKFKHDSACPGSLSLYGDPALDAVLEWLRPRISNLVGRSLTPTYSYTRIYAKGDVLHRHTDRFASEIAVTVSVRIPTGRGPSIILLKPPNLDEVQVSMGEGDACLYAGIEVEHWRNACVADGYIQLFLFFIDTQGKYFPEYAYDRRGRLGKRDNSSDAVLMVDGAGTSLRTAIAYIRGLQKQHPALMEDLACRALIDAAAKKSSPEVSDEETEAALNDFRIGQGLYSGAATQRWLDEAGLTLTELQTVMRDRVRERKLRQAISGNHARGYFDAHKMDFEVLTILRVETPRRAIAQALSAAARGKGLWSVMNGDDPRFGDLRMSRETRYAYELRSFAEAPPDSVIGPERSEEGYWLGEVLRRKPARFSRECQAAIEDLLFVRWLSERRQHAEVQWL